MKNCLLLLLLILLNAPLFSQRSPLQQVHYIIKVSLDDTRHSLDGSLTLNYSNQSSDTLKYIWFQLWPNAFKNDRTAYSEQMLDSGRNDFYFSEKEQKGYINRLVFRQGNEILFQEDHPQFIDIIKVYLNKPLAPGKGATVSTSFHVQLPYNFSGFGHVGNIYNMQNWYPAVALYNSEGWHPQPFTGQPQQVLAGYEVSITLPSKYMLQTNGQLSDSTIAGTLKTMHYRTTDVNDFIWSAELPGTKHPVPEISFQDRITGAASKILSKKILPAAGYNMYDGFQLGIFVHDFHLPENKWSYYAAPMYATASHTITGFAGINYQPKQGNYFRKIDLGINASRFSTLKGSDSAGSRIFGGFYKIAPYAKLTFPTANKHVEEWMEFRTYIIGEKDFDYLRSFSDSLYYPAEGKTHTRYLNQLTFNRASYRSLYPYDVQLQLQQASTFYRLNAEAHYFFNYAKGGGIQMRVFAAKFGYIGNSGSAESYRYQPKLTAVRGEEDYTYSNPFPGRNEFEGLASQQILMRDGGLKLRTDMFQDLQGRSDNWVASMNLNTTLPNKILPVNFPLRIFLDAGTYAGAWKKESSLPRFLYVAGLQLSLFKDLLNIYAPVLFSKEFRDSLKTVPEENGFFKRISFSIDLQRINFRQFTGRKSSN